jgi:hypothetical protein
MGFLRRAASAVNQVDVETDALVALSPSIRRVRKLEERGTPANGVITGIRFSLDDTTTRKEFAIALNDIDGWRRIGVRAQPPEAHRLRLGLSVLVKVDDDRGVLDWGPMADAWGLRDGTIAQQALRKPPADGVIDTALDARVQRRLKKGTPATGTIISLRRREVLGMASMNWDIELELPDGQRTTSGGDEVPSYAQWYAAPGAVVPVALDPKNPGKASIDWPRFAVEQFETAGFDDDPPEGSIAAELEASSGVAAVTAMSMGGPATQLDRPGPRRPHEPGRLRVCVGRLAVGRDVQRLAGRRGARSRTAVLRSEPRSACIRAAQRWTRLRGRRRRSRPVGS